MPTIYHHDEKSTEWCFDLATPKGATASKLWITHDREERISPWRVEYKIYFAVRYEERLHGWGSTRHEAFARLRLRLNDLRSIKLRA